MSQLLKFITSNSGKLRELRRQLSPLRIEVEQVALELTEPQAETIEAVALIKARQAFSVLQQPLVVDDSGFYIPELAGFPGPFTKYILQTIGAQGILDVAQRIEARSCAFEHTLVYMDAMGEPTSFVDRSGWGTLAHKADTTPCPDAWSDLWQIFIPAGYEKTLNALSSDERMQIWTTWEKTSIYTRFGEWLNEQHGIKPPHP